MDKITKSKRINESRQIFVFTKHQLEILRHIARNGPEYPYNIAKNLKFHPSNVHYTVNDFVKLGLLKLLVTQPGDKNNERKIYGLTFLGLSLILMLEDKEWELNKIIANWQDLEPLILGKWTYIIKSVPLSEAAGILFIVMFTRFVYPEIIKIMIRDLSSSSIVDDGVSLFKKVIKQVHSISSGIYPKELTITDERKAMEEFRIAFFNEVIDIHNPHLNNWIIAINSDLELKNWVTEYLERHYLNLKEGAKLTKKIIKNIQG